jgi:hypothetical protein
LESVPDRRWAAGTTPTAARRFASWKMRALGIHVRDDGDRRGVFLVELRVGEVVSVHATAHSGWRAMVNGAAAGELKLDEQTHACY